MESSICPTKLSLSNPLSVRGSMLPLSEMTVKCITPQQEKEVGRGQRVLFHPLGNRFPSLLYIPEKHQIFMPSFGPRGSHWGRKAKWCIRGRKKKICLCGHSELSSEKWNVPETEGYTILKIIFGFNREVNLFHGKLQEAEERLQREI